MFSQPKKQPESVSICELLGELLHLIRFELFDVTEKTQQMTSDGVLSAKVTLRRMLATKD